MRQGKSHKKPRIFWIYYFFIALPFFAYRFFIWEPSPYREKLPDWFNSVEKQITYLNNISQELYSSDLKKEVGIVEINVNQNNNEIILSLAGEEYSGNIGKVDTLSYTYESFSVDDQVMEPIQIDSIVLWISVNPDDSAVLIPLNPERVMEDEDKRVFLYQNMDENEFRRIIKERKSPMEIEKSIYFSINESIYSGIFIVEQ
ncbi:hypothetical protein B4O97_18955 [Marispirochaeta aestuarii]|uniref:Uncharacterized protein n=1 Tax=Marispirochaeta aestuarii TaxID=1963862 RepID=A0A1Y1RSS7_9SPIO|nr:hypothetical protein [Marispirochaeta aestuarii]ORC28825.1 hypothetical protein B4O97_18955 [Marispirochaeta aestuarii]